MTCNTVVIDEQMFGTEKAATRSALGETLIKLFEEGMPIVAVDADLAGSTTLGKFGAHSEETAKRFFNVGIAEQNMIDVAAGLAACGNIAFTGSFAAFGIGRAYDQIRNTVCYSNLNVKLTATHSGISVGPDGGSHQMLEDIALMRALPNVGILVPADVVCARECIRLAAKKEGPMYVRLGRENVPVVYADECEFELGGSHILREGSDITIVACGVEVSEAIAAAKILAEKGISAEVIDAYSVKPLDSKTIIASAKKTGRVIVAEEHSVYGGLGEAVSHVLAERCPVPMKFIGMTKFGKSGAYAELSKMFGMDADAIAKAALGE